MSQNDFQIADADGATVLADFNSALQALATLSSGNSAPSTTYAGQLWWDTGNDLIKIRNAANDGWVDFAHFDGVTYEPIAAGSDVLKADPEHATDSATDTYDSATNTTPPADGVQIIRDFQTPNTTTTPTLDGKTLTTKDGSALWPGAVSGVHALQRDQTADTYLVLEPIGTAANINDAPVSRDSNGRAKFADPSAAQDAATKASSESYADAGDPALSTVVDATNGGAGDLTEIDFTGIKSGAKRIVVLFRDISLSGTNSLFVQIGDSGGFEASGYTSSSANAGGTVSGGTSGFIALLGSSSGAFSGAMVIYLVDPDANAWSETHVLNRSSGTDVSDGAGEKTLSGELDRVRITSTGSDTFTDGQINLLVE